MSKDTDAWLALEWLGWTSIPGTDRLSSEVFDVQYVKCIDFASQTTFNGDSRLADEIASDQSQVLLLYFLLPIFTTNTRCSREKSQITNSRSVGNTTVGVIAGVTRSQEIRLWIACLLRC